jgi:transposase
MNVTTIGLDLAKSVFQVHGIGSHGKTLITKQLRRGKVLEFFANLPACLVGIEACPSAHHWAREISRLGHEVRLMPPGYVKPYVKRGKNDRADAEAICEAVQRPTMRFVPVKTEEQQSALTMHRVRDLLVRQRTQLINAVRGHLAEFGLVGAQGPWNVPRLLARMQDDRCVPQLARQVLELLAAQLDEVGQRIAAVDTRIMAGHKANPVSRRLVTIPGIGPLIATAIAATVPDPDVFRGGREFAAWLGLVPRQRSTGGKQRLGRISRLGDKYIRQLLIVGAQTVLLRSKVARSNAWIQGLLARRPRLVVAVALANKMARIVWAVMAQGQSYRQAVPA